MRLLLQTGVHAVLHAVLYAVLLLGTADGFLSYNAERCLFNSTDPKDIQLIYSGWYNKLKLFSFDSNKGKFEGYTEYGVKQAKYFNSNPAILQQWIHAKDRYCVHNIGNWHSNILTKSVEPYAAIHTAPSSGTDRVLVCSVYTFYPSDITVTWTNHKQRIDPKDAIITTTDPMADSDWFYQLHCHLEYTPRPGDQISCVVEHKSLKEPLILDYEGDGLSDGDRNKVAIGASGLVLGLVLSLAGFLYYRHKSRGLILVPNH